MTLTTWRTYLAVRRHGSLSAAAAELGYTQSAVSRQIAALEHQAGVPLVERRPRGVVMTAAGETFGEHARIAIAAADRALHVAREASTGTGVLTVGATPSAAAGIVPTALRAVPTAEEPVAWSLVTGLSAELENMVATEELDLAVVTNAPPGLEGDSWLTRYELGIDSMRVIVPPDHPAASSESLGFTAFAEETWVEDNEGSAALLRAAAARAGFQPRIHFAAADLVGKTALVAAGHAIALIPGLLTPALRPDVTLVTVPDAPTRQIYATAAANAILSKSMSRLIAALRELLGTTGIEDGESSPPV